ncbi:MAG: heavy metal-binding domain-containing protein [Ginsengibacter sp.]
MKTTLIVMLVALAATFFVSCNNGKIKVNNEATQSLTSPQLFLTSDSAYTCEMHDSVLSAHAGKCPECGMNLVKKKITPAQQELIKEGKYIQPKE